MNQRGWWCEHRDTVAIGDKFNQWKMYCNHNRLCETCHEIKVTPEFLAEHKGLIVGFVEEGSLGNY
jgi:hypothetical protein